MNKIVMILAGLLLIAASALKAQEMLSICVPGWREHGIWESWEFFLFQIPLEFSLGVWLISGLFRKAAWLAGTLAYLGFIFVTLYKAMTGQSSCGCFGQIHVNPWLTVSLIDIPLFLLLAINRPAKECKLLPPPWPNTYYAIAVFMPILAALSLTAPALSAFRPVCIKPEETQWIAGNLPAKPDIKPVEPNRIPPQQPIEPNTAPHQKPIEPDTATDAQPKPANDVKLWPWLKYVDIAESIQSGLVVVFMYHHDCTICAEMVPKYDAYYRKIQAQGDVKIAFLAIPPYGQGGPVPADTPCLHDKLVEKDGQKFAITSPFLVVLLDGQVIKTCPQGTAPEPETLLDSLFE